MKNKKVKSSHKSPQPENSAQNNTNQRVFIILKKSMLDIELKKHKSADPFQKPRSSTSKKQPKVGKKPVSGKISVSSNTSEHKKKHKTRSSSQKQENDEEMPESVKEEKPGPRTKIPKKQARLDMKAVSPKTPSPVRKEKPSPQKKIDTKIKKAIKKGKKTPPRVIATRSKRLPLEKEKQNPESFSDESIEKKSSSDISDMKITRYLKKKESSSPEVKKDPKVPPSELNKDPKVPPPELNKDQKEYQKKPVAKKQSTLKSKSKPSGAILQDKNSKGVVNIAPIVNQELAKKEISNENGVIPTLEGEKPKVELKGREKDLYNNHFMKFRTMAMAEKGVSSEDEMDEVKPMETRGMNLKPSKAVQKVNVMDLLSEYGVKAAAVPAANLFSL